jgi:hypothetical protein
MKAVFKIFIPRTIYEPTNGIQKTWQVVSRQGKVQALCLDKRHAKKIARALRRCK